MTDEELKEIVRVIQKYGEGAVGEVARRLVAEVNRLKAELSKTRKERERARDQIDHH